MTVLNTNETMTPEKILMVEELGRKVFNHPASQIWRIVENGLSPKETFIKTWIKLLKHFRVLLKREGYSGRVSFEVVFSDIHSEICILIKEDKEGILRSPALTILLEAYQNIDNAFITELPLELALVRIISKDNDVKIK